MPVVALSLSPLLSAAPVTATGQAGLTIVGSGGPAGCAVTNETGGDATAALSGASGSPGSGTLTGVVLTGTGAAAGSTLSADLSLSKASAIGLETIYIGGH